MSQTTAAVGTHVAPGFTDDPKPQYARRRRDVLGRQSAPAQP
ncbi:hypothetical protein [Nocardia wallacei]|nr:hypothetical protein [Nocardia wallacei]